MRRDDVAVSTGGAFLLGVLLGWAVSMLLQKDVYEETRKKLQDRLKALQIPLKDIDKEKYETVVKELIRELRFERRLSENQINKLKDYLVDDFSRLKERFSYES